ncbi:MAG: FAD/NAD(P)-binding protein, partial [Gemmataceae bacterium]
MMERPARLQQLVDQLNHLGREPSLVAIARVLEAVNLTPSDVAPLVQPNPRHYSRARVQLNDAYELLVMTWLPGQASVPHDHTGSICAMHVVQGDAIEADYSLGADGSATLEFETRIPAGKVSAGQDAGVHTIRNPSASEILVTVHVYAPPLREFRRFVPNARAMDPSPAPDTVVVIGGGFCGTMTAAQLLRQNACERVVLVERRGTIGEGLAYSTRDPAHLLNVPAARMSAWPDQPSHFADWAMARGATTNPGAFLPRMLYGEYLRETLLAAHQAAPGRLETQLDEARRVTRHPHGGWMVHLSRGISVRARAVVLAIGHRPPNDPLAPIWQGPRDRFLADPWRPFALNVVRPEETVAILGSGLTAIDTV